MMDLDERLDRGLSVLDTDSALPPTWDAVVARRHALARRRRQAALVASLAIAVGAAGWGFTALSGSDAEVNTVATHPATPAGPPLAEEDLRDLGLSFLCPGEVTIYFNPGATPEHIGLVEEVVSTDPRITSMTWFGPEESLADFQVLFADSPQILESVRAEDLPPSFRLDVEPGVDTGAFSDEFEPRPGVRQVMVAPTSFAEWMTARGLDPDGSPKDFGLPPELANRVARADPTVVATVDAWIDGCGT